MDSIHVTAARGSPSLCHESHLVRSRAVCLLTDAKLMGNAEDSNAMDHCSRGAANGRKTEKHEIGEGGEFLFLFFVFGFFVLF